MKSMLRFRKCLPWMWIGLAATVAGFLLNPRGIPRKPITEGLVIANSSLDIGAIWDGSPFIHKLLVENKSSTEIQVAEVLTSCSCVAASPSSFRVPANGTFELELKLDPRRGRSSTSELDRDYSAEITLLELPARKYVFQIVGFLNKHPIQLSPNVVDLGEIVHGVSDESKTGTTVTIMRPGEVADVEIQYDESILHIEKVQDSDNTNSIELKLRLRSDALLGKNESIIVIKPIMELDTTVLKGGQPFPDVELPFRVTVLPSMYANPTLIDFGIVEVGDESTANLLVHDLLSKDIQLEGISTSDDSLLVERVITKNGSDTVFSVKQKFSKVGAQSNRVELTVARKDGQTVLLTIPVRYFGKVR